jgi:glycosyltransferase involved in cell wall biosynthesis
MLNVALISGSWPPDLCGVGDYAQHVATAVKEQGVRVSCLGGPASAAPGGGLLLSKALNAGQFDLAHLQYPTVGFGRSLMPALLPLLARGVPFVVTIHEFSTFKKVRRPWFLSFAHRVGARIFTNERERTAFSCIMRPSRGEDFVIPIASNIGAGAPRQRIPNSVCNFGMISPGKGVERFLDLAELHLNDPSYSFSLIGAIMPSFANYANGLAERAAALGVETYLNLPEREVADLLASQEYAYLPFDDGASLRRGSLMALQQNGVLVLTTHSDQTPQAMRETTIGVATPAAAYETLQKFRSNPQSLEDFRLHANRVSAPSWTEIGASHLKVYNQVLGRLQP